MSACLARVAVLCLLAAVLSSLVMLLPGCTRTERGMVDPAAFSLWVMPF